MLRDAFSGCFCFGLAVGSSASQGLLACLPAGRAAGQSRRKQTEAGVVFVCITYLIKVFNE
jgi:hypothetical protein